MLAGTCRCVIPCVSLHPDLRQLLCLQVKPDFKDIVLSARQDEFYRKHMASNFGDIGSAVKDLVVEFQRQEHSTRNMASLQACPAH